ncbi:hypothetical protein MRX96_012002 [Rhipicephalus microplus]
MARQFARFLSGPTEKETRGKEGKERSIKTRRRGFACVPGCAAYCADPWEKFQSARDSSTLLPPGHRSRSIGQERTYKCEPQVTKAGRIKTKCDCDLRRRAERGPPDLTAVRANSARARGDGAARHKTAGREPFISPTTAMTLSGANSATRGLHQPTRGSTTNRFGEVPATAQPRSAARPTAVPSSRDEPAGRVWGLEKATSSIGAAVAPSF